MVNLLSTIYRPSSILPLGYYTDLVVTVQLEYFGEGVCFIRIFSGICFVHIIAKLITKGLA